ncbi:MAG: hypothetical protein ACE5IB_05025 [Candidatus Geothermarchaeales archaeon]
MKWKAVGVATLTLAALVYLQLILGGAMLLHHAEPTWVSEAWEDAHMSLGHSIWFIAIVPAVLLWRLKPPSPTLRVGGLTLVVLSFINTIFAVQGPWGSIAVMAAHGLTAGLIFAVAVALTVAALKE